MPDIHQLLDNIPCSRDSYATVTGLLREVRDLHLDAPRYVTRRRLDAETFLPGNMWASLIPPDEFPSWSYDLVNCVRCASPFTGFDLMTWRPLGARSASDCSAANSLRQQLFAGALDYLTLAERLESVLDISARIRASVTWMYEDYDALINGIPERYRLRAPPHAGELGGLYQQRIVNPDLLTYQGRVNALYAAGVLEELEGVIAADGSANYLEIGAGNCFFAHALAHCFGGALRVFLIDLPYIIGHGCAYLSCVAGAESIGLIGRAGSDSLQKPYVFVPNYLLPEIEDRLPRFHLVHNAISFNEMSVKQVLYYFDLVDRRLDERGVFHISQGQNALDHHVDALALARGRFPRARVFADDRIDGRVVRDNPNTFIRSKGP